MFAVWRTTRSSEQGRMSISLSFDDKINNSAVPSEHSDREAAPARRGWWDYVPERRPEPPTRRSTGRSTGPTGSQTDHSGIIQYVGSKLHDLWSYPPPSGGPTLHRKPSIPGEHPISQPPRTSSVSFSVRRPAQVGRASARFVDPPPNTQVVPPTSPSAMSRLSKYMPRMQLFKEVLKNEVSIFSCGYTGNSRTSISAVLYGSSHCNLCRNRHFNARWNELSISHESRGLGLHQLYVAHAWV